MIRDYDHWVFCSHEVVTPVLQGLDDNKELPVIDVIILFSRREGGRMIGAGMEIPIGVLLHEYSFSGSERGISHDEEWFGSIWHLDYGSREECFFELDEHDILFLSP